MPRRTIVLAGAAALAAAALSPVTAAPATASPARAAATPGADHVVVFGLDGAGWDRLLASDVPTIKSLIASGRSGPAWLYASPMAATSSGPGWATDLTGVWPDKHKVRDNSFSGNDIAGHPDFLTRVERDNPAFKTYAAVDWKPIGDNVITGPLDREYVLDGDADGYTVDDPKIAADAVAQMRQVGPHASFVYFGQPDIAGHTYGGASAQYRQALADADRRIAQVIAAVKARPTYSAERWTFIVTSDHGHTDAGGHGGASAQERQSFVVASGAGITPGSSPVSLKNVDVAATVLARLGIARPAVLDGAPVGTAPADVFDGLTGSLQARVDETGIPTTTRGWTKTAPSGWRIDNTGMGTGGVTEWRGWTFANDDFWTATDRGQQREGNVRARGVFAVADPDEWTDKSSSGTFNSTLVSAPYTVAGKARVTLSYSSHYLQDGPQKGTVLVSFDGGPDTVVRTYTADAKAAVEKIQVTVPAGAQRMTVKWRLSEAGNNWYWAVDAPTVS
ncbi:alkaline phosphatase family protein [Actinomadura hibisca]|uniref:alkaline phosphatase family protein n=1 Tax=Actinomadura hibisca TaxID=68565 RepID=UPI00082B370D|nr:alkaline phosphatase family protein [Actinomadura hibisca]